MFKKKNRSYSLHPIYMIWGNVPTFLVSSLADGTVETKNVVSEILLSISANIFNQQRKYHNDTFEILSVQY